MPATPATAVITNQVFIGCPWKQIRLRYDTITSNLSKSSPLSFILIGREDDQSAMNLLTVIKAKLLSSSYAIFDVTGGNPNVSLEFGIAESMEIPSALYLNTHKALRKIAYDSAIISDLAGKRRKQYSQESGLLKLLRDFCKTHPYTKRFEGCLQKGLSKFTKGNKKRYRALALKLIHFLDNKERVRRDDIVQFLKSLQPGAYEDQEINEIFSVLKKSGVIKITVGRYSVVSIG